MADVLRLALPPGTRVAQGPDHLQRQVSWARAFVSRPWVIGALETDTLVILSTRGLSAASELQTLRPLLETLLAAEVSGVVLSDDVPSLSAAAATCPVLPIFVLPPDVRLPEVERAVIGLIVDRDGQVRRRAMEVYQLLIDLAVDDRPTQGLAEALSLAAGRVVYVEDEYGILQAAAVPHDHDVLGLPSTSEAAALYSAREVLGVSGAAPAGAAFPAGCIRRVLGDHGFEVCSSPISLGGTIAGFLTLLGREGDIQDLDEQIVVRAASAFAVPIAKHRAIMETQNRLQGSFLESLFSGRIADEEEIASRARYLGHNLNDPYDTACFTVDDPPGSRGPLAEGERAGLWTSFVDLAHREILDRWPRALLRERGDVLAVLLPASGTVPKEGVRALLEAARLRLSGLVGATATAGLGGRTTGPRAIVRAYTEAEQAARIGKEFLGGNQTVSFEELGVYRVIAAVADRGALQAFYREHLGPLEDYDTRHDAELVDTLEGFFAANGNHARAADALHLHRNTLLYRLDRIGALLGRSLSDAETRLSLQLALKIRRVLPIIRASQPQDSGGG